MQLGVVWSGGAAETLAVPQGGSRVSVWNINDLGQVVGSIVGDNYLQTAAVWTNNVATYLVGLPGERGSYASDINNNSLIVGASSTYTNNKSEQHAMIWIDGTGIDLNSLLSASDVADGWSLRSANAISDTGWITGSASNSITGNYQAYRLSISVVPEPSTAMMIFIGLATVGFAIRKPAH